MKFIELLKVLGGGEEVHVHQFKEIVINAKEKQKRNNKWRTVVDVLDIVKNFESDYDYTHEEEVESVVIVDNVLEVELVSKEGE